MAGRKKGEGVQLAGRPTKYNEAYNAQAEKLCKLGATDKELADFFEVAESTINEWKLAHPEFSESIKKGKTLADAEVADRLYQRAMGYSHEAVKIFPNGEKDEDGNKQPLIVPYTEHYPPDSVAAIFWLKNRKPERWREKIEAVNTNTNYNSEPLTAEKIKEISKALEDEY